MATLAAYQERKHHLTEPERQTVNTISKPYFKRLLNGIKEPLYLDWLNNYLTLEKMSEHYYTTTEHLKYLFADIWAKNARTEHSIK